MLANPLSAFVPEFERPVLPPPTPPVPTVPPLWLPTPPPPPKYPPDDAVLLLLVPIFKALTQGKFSPFLPPPLPLAVLLSPPPPNCPYGSTDDELPPP